jgi:hypothetical protein
VFRDAVDAEAAAFWNTVYSKTSGGSRDGVARTGLAVRAGLAAVPYYARQRRWVDAAALLERGLALDPSRANVAAVLPAMLEITRHAPETQGVLGRVLQFISPAAGEVKLLTALDAAVNAGDYPGAHAISGVLTILYRDSGRLSEALAINEQAFHYRDLAGYGPWTELFDQAQQLLIKVMMGRDADVLTEARRLRARMDTFSVGPRSPARVLLTSGNCG